MLDPADESPAGWYSARAKRGRPVGTRDALALETADRRALHPFRDTPHLVVEWDGTTWQPVAVAETYADAYPLIMRRDGALVAPQDDTPVILLRKGNGRHRRA